jgi:predicted dinucleotide-utilizing enzyme
MDTANLKRRKVGILGFGALGQHMYTSILNDAAVAAKLEVVFVWNRSPDALSQLPAELRLASLEDAVSRGADVVVEVAHPKVAAQIGAAIMASGADFVIGSPTALADPDCEKNLRAAAAKGPGALYMPAGALWGATDLQALANRGSMHALTVTMRKHPASFRLTEDSVDALRNGAETAPDGSEEVVLYEGPVRGLCPLAPNNVNTMACAAMAAHTLGFDGTVGRLIADRRLITHEVEILALGKPSADGSQFRLALTRSSPAPAGAVTSKATYGSFVESLLKSGGRGLGVHFV